MGHIGAQTWEFPRKPVIVATATVVGPKEGEGPLRESFDKVYTDLYMGEKSWERAERALLHDAVTICLEHAKINSSDVQMMLAGDLTNQIISSTFTARTFGTPFMGQFGACSVSMQTLGLAALLVDSEFAKNVVAAAVSHSSTAERQFRYPTEYGGQKPPTAQCTVTGAGAALIAHQGTGPRIALATMGKVIDLGVSSPWEMGAAMAPAAVDTLTCHFRDTGYSWNDYDLVATGDLGSVGHRIAIDLLKEHSIAPDERFVDCGMMIYRKDQAEVFSGGSGAGCSAVVSYGYLLRQLSEGRMKRMLIVATGALLSTVTSLQGESIPCIAHAVTIEREGEYQ